MNGKRWIWFLGAIVVLIAALPLSSRASTLGSDVIGLFPKNVGEFAYADLKKARQFKWFPALKEQMLPPRFRQFEQFLASAGIDPNTQVEELAWAFVQASSDDKGVAVAAGEQIVGVALGKFNPNSAEAYFTAQKLPMTKLRGYSLFAFGSGAGPSDLFFFFLDSNTAAFGQRDILEKMLNVRYGQEEGLLRNDKFYSLINETNGRGVVWAVLNSAYTRLSLQQLVPEAQQFPQAGDLMGKFQALMINIDAGSTLDARFNAVCNSSEDASTFAGLLQAGFTLRAYQERQASNPELADMISAARVTPKGSRLEISIGLTEDQMMSLIRKNAFAIRM